MGCGADGIRLIEDYRLFVDCHRSRNDAGPRISFLKGPYEFQRDYMMLERVRTCGLHSYRSSVKPYHVY